MNRGLIIRAPWIDLILKGTKTWEMRSRPTNIRETIALIRQGTGLIVGAAKLIDSKPPLTRENYMSHRDKHAIPEAMLDEVLDNRWIYPWVLSDVLALEKPMPSNHRPGVVTFVILNSLTNSPDNSGSTSLAVGKDDPRVVQPASSAPQSDRSASLPSADSPERAHSRLGDEPLFEFRPENAQAYGHSLPSGEFVVLAGSTAMRRGSPNVKRDAYDRDRLVGNGVLVPDSDERLYRFAVDYTFSSCSKAAGIIKDGNASGPLLWRDRKTGKSLKDYTSNR